LHKSAEIHVQDPEILQSAAGGVLTSRTSTKAWLSNGTVSRKQTSGDVDGAATIEYRAALAGWEKIILDLWPIGGRIAHTHNTREIQRPAIIENGSAACALPVGYG
jgi:hypothetical protein